MENIKVKVNSAEESKEAQELFFELGYRWIDIGTVYYKTSPSFNYITAYCNGKTLAQGHGLDAEKEITIPQLRDLVVLKRNDVDDATHENCMFPYIKLTDGWYYFDDEVKKWLKSTGGKPEYFEKLKPIERGVKMKEYLDPDNEYALITADDEIKGDWIEVPDGAECATFYNDFLIFWKGNIWSFSKKDGDTEFVSGGDNMPLSEYLEHYEDGVEIVWQRAPSVDVEDTVNHPNHYASGAVECIEAIEASMSAEAFKGFLKGNVQKYMWRYEQKGGVESLEKAQWYLNLLLSRVSS